MSEHDKLRELNNTILADVEVPNQKFPTDDFFNRFPLSFIKPELMSSAFKWLASIGVGLFIVSFCISCFVAETKLPQTISWLSNLCLNFSAGAFVSVWIYLYTNQRDRTLYAYQKLLEILRKRYDAFREVEGKLTDVDFACSTYPTFADKAECINAHADFDDIIAQHVEYLHMHLDFLFKKYKLEEKYGKLKDAVKLRHEKTTVLRDVVTSSKEGDSLLNECKSIVWFDYLKQMNLIQEFFQSIEKDVFDIAVGLPSADKTQSTGEQHEA